MGETGTSANTACANHAESSAWARGWRKCTVCTVAESGENTRDLLAAVLGPPPTGLAPVNSAIPPRHSVHDPSMHDPSAPLHLQAAYDRGSPHGAFLLSWSYNVGEGVPQDVNKAKALLQFAISKLPDGDRTSEKAKLVLQKLEAPAAPVAEPAAATEASA